MNHNRKYFYIITQTDLLIIQNLYQSNQMSRDSRFSQYAARPKIFQKWPKDTLQFNVNQQQNRQIRQNQKKKQSYRAQQTLQKSLMNLKNIQYFQKQKKNIQQRYSAFSKESEMHRKYLQQLSNGANTQFQPLIYEKALKDFYVHIRKQSKLLREAQCLKYSNLPNYDPKHTQIIQNRQRHETQKQLDRIMEQIKYKRDRLKQSLVMYEHEIPRSQILPRQFNLQQALQDLINATSGQKLTNIHYLMQYQLRQMEDSYNSFASRVADDRANYSIYQALNDSMKLMMYQRKQMKTDRHSIFKKGFSQLNYQTAPQIVPAANASLPILMNNQKIYDSNMQLLARYNAQTNLLDYAQRRKQYASQLNKYKNQFIDWRKQYQFASFLFTKHQSLDNFKQNRLLSNDATFLKSERQGLKQGYYDIMNCYIPDNMKPAQRYRQQLMRQYEQAMNSQHIIVPQNDILLNSSLRKDPIQLASQQGKIHKYANFFLELQKRMPRDKALFLLAQKDTIRSSKFELSQSNNKSVFSQMYSRGFDFAEAIVQHQLTQDDASYMQRIQKIGRQRLVRLPIGFDPVLYYYTYDVMIKQDGQKYISTQFTPKMIRVKNSVSKRLSSNYRQQQINEVPYLILQQISNDRFFFTKIYRKISDYSYYTKKQLMDDYWGVAQGHISSAYIQSQFIEQNITKKNFVTFRVLSDIGKRGESLKIGDLSQIINHYLNFIDRYAFSRMDQHQLFLEILKQRIMIRLLQNNQYRNKQFQTDRFIMQRLNEACILSYQVNDHMNMYNNEDLQEHLSHSLKLQKAWNQLYFQKNLGAKLDLQQKCQKIINNIRKDLITLSKNIDLNIIQSIMNIRGKLKYLQLINYLPITYPFLSAVYCYADDLLKCLENMNYSYTSSDVISVSQHPEKSVYLKQLQNQGKNQLLPLEPQLRQIMRLFKGQSPKILGPVIQQFTINQQMLKKIIKDMQSMVSSK